MFHEYLNSVCVPRIRMLIQYLLFLYRVSNLNGDKIHKIHIPVCVSWLSQQLTQPPDLILRCWQITQTKARTQ